MQEKSKKVSNQLAIIVKGVEAKTPDMSCGKSTNLAPIDAEIYYCAF